MLKEMNRNKEIDNKISLLNEEKQKNFEKITKTLVKMREFETGYFYRVIENNNVHVNKTLKALCKVLGLKESSVNSNGYNVKKRGFTVEKLKVEDYK